MFHHHRVFSAKVVNVILPDKYICKNVSVDGQIALVVIAVDVSKTGETIWEMIPQWFVKNWIVIPQSYLKKVLAKWGMISDQQRLFNFPYFFLHWWKSNLPSILFQYTFNVDGFLQRNFCALISYNTTPNSKILMLYPLHLIREIIYHCLYSNNSNIELTIENVYFKKNILENKIFYWNNLNK